MAGCELAVGMRSPQIEDFSVIMSFSSSGSVQEGEKKMDSCDGCHVSSSFSGSFLRRRVSSAPAHASAPMPKCQQRTFLMEKFEPPSPPLYLMSLPHPTQHSALDVTSLP